MTVADKKAAYENSALRHLFETSGHEICKRCYCCDEIDEVEPCPVCGGFAEGEEEDDFCQECQGEGETSYAVCAGNCDPGGNHAAKLEGR